MKMSMTAPSHRLILVVLATMAMAAHATETGMALRHDPFARPDLTPPAARPATAVPAVSTPLSTEGDGTPSAWRPPLRAIVVAGSRSMVLLDRAVVAMGEQQDGYRLDAVGETSAVFVKGRQRVTLYLEKARGTP